MGLFLAFLVAVFPQPDGSHYSWATRHRCTGKDRRACGEPQPVPEFGVAPSGCTGRVVDDCGRHRQNRGVVNETWASVPVRTRATRESAQGPFK